MPVLAFNQPFESPRPNVVVENALPIGRHRFALTVVDDSGLESAADQFVVEVRRAIVDPVLPPVVAPPPVIVQPVAPPPVIVRPVPVPPVIVRPPPIRAPRREAEPPAEPGEDESPR